MLTVEVILQQLTIMIMFFNLLYFSDHICAFMFVLGASVIIFINGPIFLKYAGCSCRVAY